MSSSSPLSRPFVGCCLLAPCCICKCHTSPRCSCHPEMGLDRSLQGRDTCLSWNPVPGKWSFHHSSIWEAHQLTLALHLVSLFLSANPLLYHQSKCTGPAPYKYNVRDAPSNVHSYLSPWGRDRYLASTVLSAIRNTGFLKKDSKAIYFFLT